MFEIIVTLLFLWIILHFFIKFVIYMEYPVRTIDDHLNYEVHKKISKELESDLLEYLFEPWKGHIITKNRFPYKGSTYILWIHPKHQQFYTNERIKLILGNQPFFMSSENRMSVKNIKHYHF
jgi:hypothetical protein